MLLSARFQAFIEQSPVSVMMRGLVERLFHPKRLDEIFAKHAVLGYTRDLPFHTVADVLSEVVFTITPTVGAALQARGGTLPVSRKAFYNKLNRIEPTIGTALVRESAQELAPVVKALKVRRQPLLQGYRTRVLDGNHADARQRDRNSAAYQPVGERGGRTEGGRVVSPALDNRSRCSRN